MNPSLRSSGVTAALLTLPLGLGPPPRLETEWTVLQSRDKGVLDERASDEEEEEEVFVSSSVPLGSMTALRTSTKGRRILTFHIFALKTIKVVKMTGCLTLELYLNTSEFSQDGRHFLKYRQVAELKHTLLVNNNTKQETLTLLEDLSTAASPSDFILASVSCQTSPLSWNSSLQNANSSD